jgi:hypothetical protein
LRGSAEPTFTEAEMLNAGLSRAAPNADYRCGDDEQQQQIDRHEQP